VAFITASGAFAVSKASKLPGVNPLYTITVGNQMDLTLGDYLEYLMDDERVDVFACYLEGFKPLDGLRFFEAAREIVDRGRSVIVYRAGRTRAGAAAAASHTAAVAGNDAVFRALAAASGVVLADTLEDFEDLVRLFTRLRDRVPAGLRLGALSNAGFECVAIADRLGPFQLASWTSDTMAQLGALLEHAHLGDIVTVRNPLDLTPILGAAEYATATRLVLEDSQVDVALVGCVPLTAALDTLPTGQCHDEDLERPDGLVTRLIELNRDVAKPWIAVVDAGPLYDPMALRLEQGGVPTFRTADRALRLFGAWCTQRLRALADGPAAATSLSGRAPRA
jgi:acyl-CoA synthetase (NDP forming)